MNLDALAKRINKDLIAADEDAKRAILKWIDAGESFAVVKKELGTTELFDEWLGNQNFVKKISRKQADKYIRIATHKWEALEYAPAGDSSGVTIDDLASSLPSVTEPPKRTEKDVKELAYVGSTPGSSNPADSWNTPPEYLDAARSVLGTIGLDPFTSPAANERVKALEIFTETDDAFTKDWVADSVWMNPPYSKGASAASVDKFLEEFRYGNFKSGIVLMNASTDTAWFHQLIDSCDAFCLTRGRISFLGPDGEPSKGNTKGQVFFYFGKSKEEFMNVFKDFGAVVTL